MPELPEVETVRRGLLPVMEGKRIDLAIQRRPDLRWPLPERFAERLTGRRVQRMGRRSKYILAALDGDSRRAASGRALMRPLSRSEAAEAMADDPRRHLGFAAHAELSIEGLGVLLHRADADPELLGALGVGQAAAEGEGDISLPR